MTYSSVETKDGIQSEYEARRKIHESENLEKWKTYAIKRVDLMNKYELEKTAIQQHMTTNAGFHLFLTGGDPYGSFSPGRSNSLVGMKNTYRKMFVKLLDEKLLNITEQESAMLRIAF